ncbi:bifunctional 4-hydroxy-2-oxoglutarate aldolase/2-dehydro-3-deoxy-phosphogluconate aldolase [Taklimakanibacter lacteus]|uniref:bifunctional 4-hydroxy-2-oxoglutarate aldolase/2-dehydro-3-deoxy-phosphogluconate aldolase n=1 Tax=Taklimakanibacter lacteus TaxID=2268456 RepID=UPI000E66E04D
MQERQKGLAAVLQQAPVVPVLVIENVADAVPLAKALVEGGLPVLEITLRTRAAPDCIRAIKAEVKNAIVGSGTVLDAASLKLSAELGCAFAVSPGATPALLAAAQSIATPLLPASRSPSETMMLLEQGYALQKFFPAEQSGGAPYLAALISPLPQVRFCPTGGITADNAASYLKLTNVITVGGSWMAPKTMIAGQDWAGITRLAASASHLEQAA